MRVAVLSDTHFGDDLGTLVVEPPGGPPRLGPGYAPLARAVGRADYLVLVGDVLDFSVASFEKAYRHAKVFFTALQADGLARQIVYIPGNHDFDIWNIVEHQVNVINQLKQGELPRAFSRSVPGVIDDRRPVGEDGLVLPRVAAKPQWHDNGTKYGNLFLDSITRVKSSRPGVRSEGRKLTFNFVYPNLYLVGANGESVLVTHGHYFESYWSVASDWLLELTGDELGLEVPGELNLQELVGLNLPLNQLACTGVGQAEPLTAFVRRLQRDVEAGRLASVARLFDRFEALVVARARSRSAFRRGVVRYTLRRIRQWVLGALASHPHARYSRLFLSEPSVRNRFRRYYQHSLNELAQLSRDQGLHVPPPSHVIFGHTHQPIAWGAGEIEDDIDGHTVSFCNTGGWLLKDDAANEFHGAEVVVYDTADGFRSRSIRSHDLASAPAPAGVA